MSQKFQWNAKNTTKIFDIDLKRLYQDLDIRDYLGLSPYLIEGFICSSSGLNVSVSSGVARGKNCFIPFLNNNSGLTISTISEISLASTISIPPLSTGFLVVEFDLNSTNPNDNYFNPTSSIKFLTSMPTTYPTGSVASHILLAKVSSSVTAVTLYYDNDCAKNVLDSLIEKKLKLSAYLVTTAEGYKDNGVIFMRTGAIPGEACILLGDSGLVYSEFNPIHDPNSAYTSNLNFYNITAAMVPALYPETGLLITKTNPSNGNACILLGTSGVNYQLTVNLINLPTSNNSLGLLDVFLAGTSPTIGGAGSGLRLTRDPKVLGSSSIILGSDGISYSQPI